MLVVDDEEDVAGMLSDLLKELGVTATVVPDAESAWRALTREGRVFDAITLDLRMPGTSRAERSMSGSKRRVPAAAARVIFLTGDTADAETERFLRDAGRPVLTKPLALEPLALALAPLLLSAARRPGLLTRHGGCDPRRQCRLIEHQVHGLSRRPGAGARGRARRTG